MTVHLVAVGRVRDPAVRTVCEHYLKRARRAFPVQVREVPRAGRAGPTATLAQRLEGERLRAALPASSLTVALTRTGQALSSDDLARNLERWRQQHRDVAFVLGGADGLSKELCEEAALALSLSAMTLPHELARLVLLEQIYRAGTILRGEPYHRRPAS